MMLDVDMDRLHEVCQRCGIIRLEIFGSSARGTAGPDSDIDLLYTLAPSAHLGWEIEDLVTELQTILGRPVDLTSRRTLNKRLRDQVLQEARAFYAAA